MHNQKTVRACGMILAYLEGGIRKITDFSVMVQSWIFPKFSVSSIFERCKFLFAAI
jgi:hypothetical protein